MIDSAIQNQLRSRLWSLFGNLPGGGVPVTAEVIAEEDFPLYTLQKLVLGLNGIEPVPAYFCRSKAARGPAPAVVYNHAHGGDAVTGKDEAIAHRPPLQSPPMRRRSRLLASTHARH